MSVSPVDSGLLTVELTEARPLASRLGFGRSETKAYCATQIRPVNFWHENNDWVRAVLIELH